MSVVLPRETRAQPRHRRRTYVAFALEGRRWVLPAEDVDSVAEPPLINPLPTADRRRRGVFVHRDSVVAVVSAPDYDSGGSSHCVVLREEGFAVLVDELLGLEVTHDDRIPEGFDLFDRGALERTLVGAADAPSERGWG